MLFFNTGNFEVGVHIADVSYFVEEGRALDVIASQRATSVYLVQKVRLLMMCCCTLWEIKSLLSISFITPVDIFVGNCFLNIYSGLRRSTLTSSRAGDPHVAAAAV